MKPSLCLGLFLSLDVAMACAVEESATARIRSSFDANRIARDPFHPIEPKDSKEQSSVVVPVAVSAVGELEKLFRVTAFSIDRLSIAVINRRAFAEKETFTVKAKDRIIRVTVLKVTESGVKLDCDGTILTVPIIRDKPASMDGE